MSVKPEEAVMADPLGGQLSESNDSPGALKKNTGRTFRDGVRKIDLILVVKDEENVIADSLKNNFFTNILKMGLEIEYESGVMPIHKKLLFFKVHCPNDVLNNLGNAFGVKFVQSTRTDTIMAENEREWINLVRREYIQPLQYSSLDRSLVVYMTLLNVAFGDRQNYIGLERLMKRNIVVDAYALHDGPYFIPQDASNINARQILFYNWVGIKNVFKRQPLNLIHEYFGPRIALYFAFYGLYNLALVIAAIGALITLFLAVFKNENYIALIALICDEKKAQQTICFSCFQESKTRHACYIVKLFRFCNWYTINVLADNKYTPFFAGFIILWGMFFTAYWLGREKYLTWIWEAHNKEYNRKHTRPEFEVDPIKVRKSKKTGITMIGKPRYAKIKILACYIGIILLAVIVFVTFLRLRKLQDKSYIKTIPKNVRTPEKIILRLILTMIGFVIVLYIMDLIQQKVASYIVEKENHKTYESYSRSLAKHLYIMCFPLPLIILFYYGFQLAHFELWRGFLKDEEFLLDDTCLMTSCLFELSLAFTIILLLRFTIFRKLSLYSSLTDYNQRVENVPCWEREYILPRFNEDTLMNKMKILVIQFTLIISFGFACPPAILIVLFFNIYDMRRDTELFTLHYRRPLLLKDKAFNIWSRILKLMVYLAIIISVVALICSTDSIETYLREQRKEPGGTLAKYFDLFFYNTRLSGTTCFTRAYVHVTSTKRGRDYLENQLTVDELRTYQYMYIFIFEIVMAAIFLILQYIFSIDIDEKAIPKKRERISDTNSGSRSSSVKEILD